MMERVEEEEEQAETRRTAAAVDGTTRIRSIGPN